MTSYKDIITEWLSNPETLNRVDKQHLDSRHIDELVTNLPAAKADILKMSFDLYAELVDAYQDNSNDMMATLVIGVKETEQLTVHSLEDLIDGDLELWAPPELFLIKREPNLSPYAVEEYKVPIAQSMVTAKYGTIHAYYRTMRNGPDDPYSPGFYFEHYPDGNIDHDQH